MAAASDDMRFEEAASLRDLLTTVEEIEQRQKMAAANDDDIDIFGVYAEPPMVALNLFHLRHGQIVDRREFFWEDQEAFDAPEFFSSLLLQIYLDQQLHSRRDPRAGGFRRPRGAGRVADRKNAAAKWRSAPAARPEKALMDMVETNAKHSFEARFRVLKPSSKAIQEALQDALNLPAAPARIECFDISHIQGTDKVASMVVWEDGR